MASDMIQIETPKPTELVKEMAPVVALARSFSVTDIESDRIAQEYGQRLRRAEKSWTDYCEPARKAADEAKKTILRLRDGILGPWAEARSIFFAKSDAYQAEERRKAEAETRRLQEQARKDEEERQIADAIAADQSGDKEASEAILREEPIVPLINVAPAVAKVEGVTSRLLWSARVTDLDKAEAFLMSRPEWKALREKFIPIIESGLRSLAIAQREALNIPGVRAVSEVSRSTR